jgi:hypothetical protein
VTQTSAQNVEPALSQKWAALRQKLESTGALLIQGELAGESLYVPMEQDGEVLLALLARGLTGIVYVAEVTWLAVNVAAVKSLVAQKVALSTGDSDEFAYVDDENEQDTELRSAVSEAGEGAHLALAATKEGELASVRVSAVVQGVQHELVLDAPWYEGLNAALGTLELAVGALEDPPLPDPALRAARWEQLQAEREAAAAVHEAELAALGEQLIAACTSDALFRSSRSEPDRWQRAQTLLRPLMTWPELSQQDRGILRPVARRAYEHVTSVLAPELRDQARADIAVHSEALRRVRGWELATSKADRRRLARSYLAALDPLLDDALLADEIVLAALVVRS